MCRRESDAVDSFPFLTSLGFLSGYVYEWSTLKLTLYIVDEKK